MPDVFSALSDPTRRQIVDWLVVEDSGTATGFAKRLPISRQAVARHLTELEQAGVVESVRVGRETRYTLLPDSLVETSNWLLERARLWDRALGRLEGHLNRADQA